MRGWNRVYVSCGHQGHGVSRCSRIDTLFLFLLAGWSISVRKGRYRETRTSMDGRSYTTGKGGWSGRKGQPPGSSEIVVRLTLGGGGGARQLGNNYWGTPVDIPGPQMSRLFCTGKPPSDEGWTTWTSGIGQ